MIKNIPEFNRIFKRFKAEAEKRKHGAFQHRVFPLPGGSFRRGYMIKTHLAFEAKREASYTTLEEAEKPEKDIPNLALEKERNEKDHLASILDMCGLLPGVEDEA